MASGWKLCEPGRWTPLYQGPSFGFVYGWALTPPQGVRWRAITAAPPFYMEGSTTVQEQTTVFYGLPTPYVQFEVMTSTPTLMRGT